MTREDADFERIQRHEEAMRLEGILDAVSAPHDLAHAREAYRHAHTLAGISEDVEVVDAARRLARLYTDARGNIRVPDAAEEAQVAALARRLALRLAQR